MISSAYLCLSVHASLFISIIQVGRRTGKVESGNIASFSLCPTLRYAEDNVMRSSYPGRGQLACVICISGVSISHPVTHTGKEHGRRSRAFYSSEELSERM